MKKNKPRQPPINYKNLHLEAAVDLVAGQGFTHLLTLHYNAGARSLNAIARDMKHLHALVDKARLGRWFYVPSLKNQRSHAFFFVEKAATSAHVHSFWRLPPTDELKGMEVGLWALFPAAKKGLWTDIVPSGHCKLESIKDQRACASYALKEQHRNAEVQTFIVSDDFLVRP